MPLLINLRQLETKSLALRGVLTADDLEIGALDELIRAHQPLAYDLEAQQLDNAVLVQGTLRQPLECECVRCLKPFSYVLTLENWACHLPLAGEDKVPIDGDCVDLTPYIREDILLAFPQHPLCDSKCVGLTGVRKNRDKEPGEGEAGKPSAAWAALNQLKL